MINNGFSPQMTMNRPASPSMNSQLEQTLQFQRLQNLSLIQEKVHKELSSPYKSFGPRELADYREAIDFRKLDHFA